MSDAVERPKSRKELRLEKKAAAAAKKKADESSSSAISSSSSKETKNKNENENENENDEKIILEKSEYRRLKKIKQKELDKEKEKLERKEIREEQKIRKRKKLHREINAPGGGGTATTAASKKRKKAIKKQQQKQHNDDTATTVNENERDVSMDVFQSVFQGSKTNDKGITTTRLGVQYEDIVIGKGEMLKEGIPIICKYELTGGRFGAVIDSSKRFQFRLGMGEVIQGWDIGLEGMKIGGRRKLIVPPKAGYGGKDIGGK
jgi:FK506-binding nuclear protein